MPDRKKRKGSFREHFDELVTRFDELRPTKTDDKKQSESEPSIHDRLFERAWREERD